MANYQLLKADIDAKVYQNGEQEITGANLNSVLNQMVNILGTGYQFAGVATTATNPGTPDAKVFYIANGKGTYTNFGGIDVTEDDVVVLYWDTAWHKEATGIASNEKLSELVLKIGQLGLTFGGVVSKEDVPEDGKFYIATESGQYVNFNNIVVGNEIAILYPKTTKVPSSNLLRLDNLISNHYIDNLTGELTPYDNWSASPRIDVSSYIGKRLKMVIYKDGEWSIFTERYGAYYKTSGYSRGISATASVQYITPNEGENEIAISFETTTLPFQPMLIEESINPSEYIEPYIDVKVWDKISIPLLHAGDGIKIEENTISLDLNGKTTTEEIPLNPTWTSGYLAPTTGAMVQGGTYSYSNPISVKKGDVINVKSDGQGIAVIGLYENTDSIYAYSFVNAIDGTSVVDYSITCDRDCYVRFSCKTTSSWSGNIVRTTSTLPKLATLKKFKIAEWNWGGLNMGVSSYRWINGNTSVYTKVASSTDNVNVYADTYFENLIGVSTSFTSLTSLTIGGVTYSYAKEDGTGIPADILQEKISEYKTFIAKHLSNVDVLLCTEYRENMDRANSVNTYDTLLSNFFPYYQLGSTMAVFSKMPIELESLQTLDNRPCLLGKLNLGSVIVGLGLIHPRSAEGEEAEDIRIQDHNFVISFFNEVDKVIIGGDFNTYVDRELNPYRDNGYQLGNCGYFGNIDTYMPSTREWYIDNIVTKGFSLNSFKKIEERALSDHFPVVANVSVFA